MLASATSTRTSPLLGPIRYDATATMMPLITEGHTADSPWMTEVAADRNPRATELTVLVGGTAVARHGAASSACGQDCPHGVRSTVRPASIASAGKGVAGPSPGRRSCGLSRRSWPDGLRPASGGRQVHTRRSGGVHQPAAGGGVRRGSAGGCAGLAAIGPTADDEHPALRAARRGAPSSRMDRNRAPGSVVGSLTGAAARFAPCPALSAPPGG
jgi:hypothetical protein